MTHDMVHQMSLASSPYDYDVSEFEKAGFTSLASDMITPPRVKESPVQFECKVNEVIELGDQGGAGNLIICEVLRIHVKESLLDQNEMIDQHKIDLVSRMGGNWYCRADKNSMFEIQNQLQHAELDLMLHLQTFVIVQSYLVMIWVSWQE